MYKCKQETTKSVKKHSKVGDRIISKMSHENITMRPYPENFIITRIDYILRNKITR